MSWPHRVCHTAAGEEEEKPDADADAQADVLDIDNWFTSPAVLAALKQRGIRCCGSVRRNRRGMPNIPEADVRALGRGEWIQKQKGDTSLAVWKDQKVV